jgi:hypothetical protein
MSETNGNGKTGNLPGLYRHPETGSEIVTQHDGKLGSAMSDGAVQVGFKYVGPAPKEAKVAPVAETSKSNK